MPEQERPRESGTVDEVLRWLEALPPLEKAKVVEAVLALETAMAEGREHAVEIKLQSPGARRATGRFMRREYLSNRVERREAPVQPQRSVTGRSRERRERRHVARTTSSSDGGDGSPGEPAPPLPSGRKRWSR